MLGYDYSMHQASSLLLEKLKSSGAITEKDTYITIRKNKNLMNIITLSVVNELSENIYTGVYGLGIISDFDLYVNLNTLFKNNEIVPHLNFVEKCLTYNKLRTNRLNLKQFIRRQRDKIILDFKLPETPMKHKK